MKKIYRFLKKLFHLKDNYSSLTVIGVGPGDPSLLTIAAIKALRKSKVIFYPISSDDKKSLSAEIVKNYIKSKKQLSIIFPMARKGYNATQIWNNAAVKIIKYIKKNKSVALLCLGDTSIFASSSYIVAEIKKIDPEIKINIIPGISSISLAASLANFQLINHGKILKIFECPNDSIKLSHLLRNNGNFNTNTVFVLMKVGRRWSWVKNTLIKENIFKDAFLAVNLGMRNQFIGKASDYLEEDLPYFSLILIRN